MKPCGKIHKKENYYPLTKDRQIRVTINTNSCDAGKKAVITAIPAFGSLTADSLVEIRIGRRKVCKIIGAFIEKKEVLEKLRQIDR